MRGRPGGRRRSQKDNQLLEYLAKVATKYDTESLFNSLLKAHQFGKCKSGELLIECRGKERNKAIMLITKGSEVVGQFSISERLLKEETDPLYEFASEFQSIRSKTRKTESGSHKIGDLRFGMKQISLSGQILRMEEPIQITTRSGHLINVVNAMMADETGTVSLSLLGSQIRNISTHDLIQIENAYVGWFKGERQLRIGRHGKISVLNQKFNSAGSIS